MKPFDRLKARSDVFLWYSEGVRGLEVEFSRLPDITVVQWLKALAEQPFVYFISRAPISCTVYINRNWDMAQVSEAIAQSLEQEHGLTVRREVVRAGKRGKVLVESFAELG